MHVYSRAQCRQVESETKKVLTEKKIAINEKNQQFCPNKAVVHAILLILVLVILTNLQNDWV